MSLPKIQPCPDCLDGGDPELFTYENGWRHVECLDCDRLGPGEGSQRAAIVAWNAMGRRLPAISANPKAPTHG